MSITAPPDIADAYPGVCTEPGIDHSDMWNPRHWGSTGLSDFWVQYLASRGVAPLVARTRGYESCGTYDELCDITDIRWPIYIREHIDEQDEIDILCIPLYHAGTDVPSTWQIRMDPPREVIEDGVIRRPKFEARGKVNGGKLKRGPQPGDLPADVHPLAFTSMRTFANIPGASWAAQAAPGYDIAVTEGIPKADALLSAAISEELRLVPVAMTGVTMPWESCTYVDEDGNEQVVRALAPHWEPLLRFDPPTRAYVVYDSDRLTNAAVDLAAIITGEVLTSSSRSMVESYLVTVPCAPHQVKGGVDDWLAHKRRTARADAYPDAFAEEWDDTDEHGNPIHLDRDLRLPLDHWLSARSDAPQPSFDCPLRRLLITATHVEIERERYNAAKRSSKRKAARVRRTEHRTTITTNPANAAGLDSLFSEIGF